MTKIPIFCFMLFIGLASTTIAHASTSVPDSGAIYIVNVVKNNKSITITPNATQIAKGLRGGFLGIAIHLALDATDYILDPNHHTVKVRRRIYSGVYAFPSLKIRANSAQEVCQQARDIAYKDHPTVKVVAKPGRPEYTLETSSSGNCIVTGKFQSQIFTGNTMGMWTQDVKNQTQTTSLIQIAEQLIEQANQGDPKAQKLIQDILQEQANKGEFEEEFKKASEREKDTSKPDEKEKEEDKKKKCLPVTEPNIRMVLEPTTELTAQDSVSLAKIKGMVTWIENGGATSMDPIRVYENYLIVNGNHRFIAMKLCRMNAPRINWAASQIDIKRAYPIKNIRIDESWYGD